MDDVQIPFVLESRKICPVMGRYVAVLKAKPDRGVRIIDQVDCVMLYPLNTGRRDRLSSPGSGKLSLTIVEA